MRIGRSICWYGTYNCADLLVFREGCASHNGHDSKYHRYLFLSLLTGTRVKFLFEEGLLPSEESRRNLSEHSEPESRLCFSLPRTEKT